MQMARIFIARFNYGTGLHYFSVGCNNYKGVVRDPVLHNVTDNLQNRLVTHTVAHRATPVSLIQPAMGHAR